MLFVDNTLVPFHVNTSHYKVLKAVSYTHLDVYKRQRCEEILR